MEANFSPHAAAFAKSNGHDKIDALSHALSADNPATGFAVRGETTFG